jgi:glycopeptide antibiotics resistance protein
MTSQAQIGLSSSQPLWKFRWSLRVLALALAGIFLLTLYPFHIYPHVPPGSRNPFILQGFGKQAGIFDAFLNVLLFVPYGFGLAGLLRSRGCSRLATIAFAFVSGFLLSYSIEFTQLFIPDRDSGWEDTFTNSSGALVGALCFQAAGMLVLSVAQKIEVGLQRSLTARRVLWLLSFYFIVWMVFSVNLQRAATLHNWLADSLLIVGSASDRSDLQAWKGQIRDLEFWDQSLPDDVASRLTTSSSLGSAPSPIVAFDFSGAPPFADRSETIPNLIRMTKSPSASNEALWSGRSWLSTAAPASSLVEKIQKSGRFSIHMRFVPAVVNDDLDDRLVFIGHPDGQSQLELRQAATSLALWFRNPVAPDPYDLEWSIPGIFVVNQARNILFSFDGSKLWLFVDGRYIYGGFRLGPATALARVVRQVKTAELRGYRYVFYAIVFFPAGCLLGFAWRGVERGMSGIFGLFALGTLLPCVLFEIVLVQVGTQPVSVGTLSLSVFMSVAGWIWINLEGRATAAPSLG